MSANAGASDTRTPCARCGRVDLNRCIQDIDGMYSFFHAGPIPPRAFYVIHVFVPMPPKEAEP